MKRELQRFTPITDSDDQHGYGIRKTITAAQRERAKREIEKNH